MTVTMNLRLSLDVLHWRGAQTQLKIMPADTPSE